LISKSPVDEHPIPEERAIFDFCPIRKPTSSRAFSEAQAIISSMTGYLSHRLFRCIEQQSRYLPPH
jgi:hypothetical protein